MSTRRRIAVVTTSRADYSHLYWPLRDLAAHPEVDLQLLVCGAHLSPAFGSTVKEMERDGFAIAERIECLVASDTDVGMAKTLGLAVLGLADTLARLRPDLLLLIADRYEMLAPAAVGLTLRIPIAHIEGGDISEGAIDDAVRNAITKMAHLHFTSTEGARARVIGMGEEPWRVRRAGAPSLDHLRRGRLLGREELEAALGVSLEQRPIVIATHPVTLLRDTTEEAEALFSALHYLTQHRAYRRHPLLFCYPNADAGSQALVERARRFCEHHPAASLDKDPGRPAPSAAGLLRTHAQAAASGVTEPAAGARLFVNLPAGTYWSLLAQAEMLVGNSSSGIMEAASFGLPVVNIGLRQQGRERARNVLDAAPDRATILARIAEAASEEFRGPLSGMTNPYGDGRASERIVETLTTTPLASLLHKRGQPAG